MTTKQVFTDAVASALTAFCQCVADGVANSGKLKDGETFTVDDIRKMLDAPVPNKTHVVPTTASMAFGGARASAKDTSTSGSDTTRTRRTTGATCEFALTRGKSVGKPCGKNVNAEFGIYCKSHGESMAKKSNGKASPASSKVSEGFTLNKTTTKRAEPTIVSSVFNERAQLYLLKINDLKTKYIAHVVTEQEGSTINVVGFSPDGTTVKSLEAGHQTELNALGIPYQIADFVVEDDTEDPVKEKQTEVPVTGDGAGLQMPTMPRRVQKDTK
jgi:hypothetical protein